MPTEPTIDMGRTTSHFFDLTMLNFLIPGSPLPQKFSNEVQLRFEDQIDKTYLETATAQSLYETFGIGSRIDPNPTGEGTSHAEMCVGRDAVVFAVRVSKEKEYTHWLGFVDLTENVWHDIHYFWYPIEEIANIWFRKAHGNAVLRHLGLNDFPVETGRKND